MPDSSQTTPTPKSNLASDGLAQAAPETPNQPDQKASSLSKAEFMVMFQAASERAAKMTHEEIQQRNGWSMSELRYRVH